MNAVIKQRAKIQRGIDITVGPTVALSLLAIATKLMAMSTPVVQPPNNQAIELRMAAIETHQTETDKRINDQYTLVYEKLLGIQGSISRIEGKLEK